MFRYLGFILCVCCLMACNGQQKPLHGGPIVPNENLKALEWILGNWVDEDDDVTVETQNRWDLSGQFIIQDFLVQTEDEKDLSGIQIIGWDPVRKQIHSWIFDSDGAIGEGVWKKEEKLWTIETKQTLADGESASSFNILTLVNADSYKWESINRTVGGDILPDVEPVLIVRKK